MTENTTNVPIEINLEWFFSGRLHLENITKGVQLFKARAKSRFALNDIILSEPIRKIGAKHVGEFVFNEKISKRDLIINCLKRKGTTVKFELIDKEVPIVYKEQSFTILTKIIDLKISSNTSGVVSNIYVNIEKDSIDLDTLVRHKDYIEEAIGKVITKFYDSLKYVSENFDRDMFFYVEEAIKLTKHNEEELTIQNIEANSVVTYNSDYYPVFTKMVEMYLEYIN